MCLAIGIGGDARAHIAWQSGRTCKSYGDEYDEDVVDGTRQWQDNEKLRRKKNANKTNKTQTGQIKYQQYRK